MLDDVHYVNLREAIEALGSIFMERGSAQTRYLSRTVQSNVQSLFEAGDLNFGIDATHRLSSSGYIASLDADLLPQPDWLVKMIRHSILEDRVGLAIPPHTHDNPA